MLYHGLDALFRTWRGHRRYGDCWNLRVFSALLRYGKAAAAEAGSANYAAQPGIDGESMSVRRQRLLNKLFED